MVKFFFFPWRKLLAGILEFQGNWNCFFISKIIHCILPCVVQCFWHEEPWRGAVAADSAGNTLRSRQPKAASPHSREMPWETGICWILKLVGDRCQESVSCRDEIYLGRVQRSSDTEFAGYPRFLSTTVGCPCCLWGKVPSGAQAVLPVLSKQQDPGSKVSTLFWPQEKLWSCFESGGIFLIYSAQQPWEHEDWAGGERRVIQSCCPSSSSIKLLNKAVNLLLQMGESPQLLFLPSRAQHWKLHHVSLWAGKFPLIFFGFF